MASYKTVQRELERFLNQTDWEDGHVMAIYGEWGIGKTHICRQFLTPPEQEKITWCESVSRFFNCSWSNLRSLWKNKVRIIKAIWNSKHKTCSITLFSPDNHKDKKVYVSLFGLETINDVKRSLCFGGSDLTNIGKLVSVKLPSWKGVSVSADVLTTIAFSKIYKKTIFLDDLERLKDDKDLNRDLLGLISTLKEKHKCRIILVLNPLKLGEKENVFLEYKEKIIDSHITLSPSHEEVSAILFPVKHTDEADNVNKLEEYCNALRIKNLRTIKKILYRYKMLAPYLDCKLEHYDKVEHLVYSHLVFYSDKEDKPEYKAISSENNSTKTEEPQKSIKRKVSLDSLNPESVGFPRVKPLSKTIIFLIEKGYINEENIRMALKETLELFEQETKSASFHAAWEDKFHGSFDQNDDEVLQTIQKTAIDNIENLSTGDMDNVIGLLDEYSENYQREIDELLLEFFRKNKDNQHLISDIRGRYLWPEVKNKTFMEALDNFAEEAYQAINAEKSLKDVLLNMQKGSWSLEDEQYLSDVTVDEYYELFKNTNGQDLKHINRILMQFMNIVNGKQAQKRIEENVKEALLKIGKESPLNRHRIAKYGFSINDKTEK